MYKVFFQDLNSEQNWLNQKEETLEKANEWAQKMEIYLSKIGIQYSKEGPVDLSLDPAWVEKDIQEKRRKEYPTETEVIEALLEEIEGRPEKLTELLMKREEIKIKYPKPVKQGK